MQLEKAMKTTRFKYFHILVIMTLSICRLFKQRGALTWSIHVNRRDSNKVRQQQV